ncbi:unnamed protein product [Caenorhabditis auriculariae]|uniref:Cyclin-like domain-containing protein n=1 Tax=Caenorhabditis auriculariae TaxID=2777116 RepID=A0A8S1HL63_9PELO|nr:unnamed protein product [Caenorhabditis auriculariae]
MINRWIWTSDEVKNAPSIRAGMSQKEETRLRREGCKIVVEVGSTLRLKANPTMATASTYFHRFYMYHTFSDFPRELTALGCLFLAGKVEETPKKCRDICNSAVQRFPDIFNSYASLTDEVMGIERVLLQTLKFDLQVDLPYEALLEYGKIFPGVSKEQMSETIQIAWTFINDSYYTTLCITVEAQLIAIALLHLAFTVKEVKLGAVENTWWEQDVSNWSNEAVDRTCHMVLDFYTATKENPIFAEPAAVVPNK